MKTLVLNEKKYNEQACVELFDKAKKSIKIIVPDAAGIDFFWNKSVIESLARAIGDRGVSVQAAYYCESEVKGVGIFKIPGIKVFRLEKQPGRLGATIDANYAIIQIEKNRMLFIDDVALMLSGGVSATMAKVVEEAFDEITAKKSPQ